MNYTEEQRNLFIEQFNKGKSISEIAKENNTTYNAIHYVIKPFVTLRPKKYIKSVEDEHKIIEMYKSGSSTVKIGKMYNCGNKVIADVLEKYNIPRTGVGRRKYNLNENYFDIIDTQNKAYILGFLFADGSNCRDKSTVTISLQEEDKYILEAMRNEIKSEKELEFLDYSNKHDFGYSYKNQYRLLLYSSHICDSLIKLGMIPNKSLQLDFPKIPKNLYSHFIRGYFDGDGSYVPHITNNGKFQPILSFTSTEKFCRQLQTILLKNLNVSGGGIYDASCHNGITKVLQFSGRNQIESILNWIYKDANLFLTRKYEKYINSYVA